MVPVGIRKRIRWIVSGFETGASRVGVEVRKLVLGLGSGLGLGCG